MMIFLLLLAVLALVGIALTVVQVAHDGYGHPSTIPSNTFDTYDTRADRATR